MHFLMPLYMALLFFVLAPGILVTLPPRGKKINVALVHAVVFALVYYLTHKAVYRMLAPYEGFALDLPPRIDVGPGGSSPMPSKENCARAVTAEKKKCYQLFNCPKGWHNWGPSEKNRQKQCEMAGEATGKVCADMLGCNNPLIVKFYSLFYSN